MNTGKQTKTMSSLLHFPSHGESLAAALASNLRQSAFADVKLICADGSAWAHRLVLAAVSPVLKQLLLSSADQDEIATLYLPQLSKYHLALVLDYVYRGKMYIKVRVGISSKIFRLNLTYVFISLCQINGFFFRQTVCKLCLIS